MISKAMLDKFAMKLTQMQAQSPHVEQITVKNNESKPSISKIKEIQTHQIQKNFQKQHILQIDISQIDIDNKQQKKIIDHNINLTNNNFIILDDSDQQQCSMQQYQYQKHFNNQKLHQLQQHKINNKKLKQSFKQLENQKNQYIMINKQQNKQEFLQAISNNHLIENYKNKKIKKTNKKIAKKSTQQPFLIQQQFRKQNIDNQQSHQPNKSKQHFPFNQQPNPPVQSTHQLSNNSFQQPNNKNNSQQLYVYMMNNLLGLCGKIPSKIIKFYMKQLSQKHALSFHKILIDFGIQELIAKFYQNHDIQGFFHQKYILSELQQLIPQLIFQVNITNWDLIRKIVQGVFNWFRISEHYNDDWLINAIKKKRKILKEYNVNYELTLAMAKGTSSTPTDSCEQPSGDQALELGYTSLKEYLSKNHMIQQSNIEIEQTDDEKLQCDQKSVHIYQLKYYKKIKQKISNLEKQNKSATQNKQDNNNQYINHNNVNLIPLEIEIVKIGCKLPSTVEILSQFQQSEEQDAQKNNHNIPGKPGSKQTKTKQKPIQNPKNRSKSKQKILPSKSHPTKIAKSVRKQCYQPNQQLSLNNDNLLQISQHSSSSAQPQKDAEISSSSSNILQRRVRKTTQSQTKLKQKVLVTTPHQKQLTLKQSYKQCPNYSMIKSDELLKKLDQILYEFFLRQPEFTTKAITNQIERILKEQLKVPTQYHQQIQLAWFKKYASKQ